MYRQIIIEVVNKFCNKFLPGCEFDKAPMINYIVSKQHLYDTKKARRGGVGPNDSHRKSYYMQVAARYIAVHKKQIMREKKLNYLLDESDCEK